MNGVLKKIWAKNKAVIILALVFIIIGLSQSYFYKSKPQLFTIGSIIDSEAPVRGDLTVVFDYSFKGKKHTARQGRNNHTFEIGKRYFVSIPEGYPSQGWMLLDKPVPDSIKTAPPEGWKELPVKFKE